MASLIKNQILKHLSKFVKNLSSDKIHLSTFKGEGELSNLELNEDVLMELMDLPTWLRLTKAICNKVNIRIQWTKIKSLPIVVNLDEVTVEMETCDEPRVPHYTTHGEYSTGGRYGFIDKVIDGMSVSVNLVTVKFQSHTFQASIQLSRIQVESKNPLFANIKDIRSGRIKDTDQGFLLLFKVIEWSTLRIEASSVGNCETMETPLRLIANQSKIRITLKKRLSDCSIVASKLQLILDDILWVLTESQLKATILFAKSLQQIIEKSARLSKMKAGDKIQKQSLSPSPSRYQETNQKAPSGKTQSNLSKLFGKFNIKETSYHLFSNRIDLHLCDEFNSSREGSNKRRIKGGAIQITLQKLLVDHYPFHISGSEKKHWFKFSEYMAARDSWVETLLTEFQSKLGSLSKMRSNKGSSKSTSLERKTREDKDHKPGAHLSKPSAALQLMESCFVIRLEDFSVYHVSTPENRKSTPQKFLASDKKTFFLPPDMSSMHFEYTTYYYPNDMNRPVPNDNIYVMVNPVRLVLDYTTLLWANQFGLSLATTAEFEMDDSPAEHIDVKLEALMPRIVVPAEKVILDQPERPDALQVQTSKLTITNCRVDAKSSRDCLLDILVKLQKMHLLQDQDKFPNSQDDFEMLPSTFEQHVSERVSLDGASNKYRECNGVSHNSNATNTSNLRYNSLRTNAEKDIWCLVGEHLCLEFLGIHGAKGRPVPFLESLPVTLWLARPLHYSQSEKSRSRSQSHDQHNSTTDPKLVDRQSKENNILLKDYYHSNAPIVNNTAGDDSTSQSDHEKLADVHLIVDVKTKVRAQLDHYQYLFLMRLVESVTTFNQQLEEDTKQMTNRPGDVLQMVTSVIVEELEFAVVAPPTPSIISNDINNELYTDISDDKSISPDKDSSLSLSDAILDQANIVQDLDTTLILDSTRDDETTDSENKLSRLTNDEIVDMQGEDTLHVGSDGTVIMVSRTQRSRSIEETRYNKVSNALESKSYPSPHLPRKDTLTTKRSIAASFTSKFDKVKHSLTRKESDASELSEDFDTMSLSSALSSDDDFCVIDGDLSEVDVLSFDVHSDQNSLQSGSAADKDESSSISSVPDKTRMVSVTSYTLYNTELIVQIADANIKCKAITEGVKISNHGNNSIEDFRYKFSTGTDKPTPGDITAPPIRLVYMVGPNAELLAPTAGERGYLSIKAKGHDLKIDMGSINSLTDLIEDEIEGLTMPMRVEIQDFDITIQNDLPPTNATSPGTHPIVLHVDRTLVTREQDGVFHIAALNMQDNTVSNEIGASLDDKSLANQMVLKKHDVIDQAQKENDKYRQKISKLERELVIIKTENQTKMADVAEENDSLSARMTVLQDEVEDLRTERESLMKTLEHVQRELFKADRLRLGGNIS